MLENILNALFTKAKNVNLKQPPLTIEALDAHSKATNKYYFRDIIYVGQYGRVYDFFPLVQVPDPIITLEQYDTLSKEIYKPLDEASIVKLRELQLKFNGGIKIDWTDENSIKFPKSIRDIKEVISFCENNNIDKNKIQVSRWKADESGWPNEIVKFNLGTGEEIESSSGNGTYNKNRNLYKL